MKNTDVFNHYDLVVSYTQELLNYQLYQLSQTDIIDTHFVLVQKVNDRNFEYEILHKDDPIPEDSGYISGEYIPQIHMSKSGSNVTFIMHFVSGKARFWEGPGRYAQLTEYDMTAWHYAIDIDLNLAEIKKEAIAANKRIPELVKKQLENFDDDLFRIDHLFMNFESANLLKFNPVHTHFSTLDASGEYHKDVLGNYGQREMENFMQFFLENLLKDGNPFILGYSVTSTGHHSQNQENKVPDTLQPIGTTFTVYNDPKDAYLSNLNFVLNTKGGKGPIKGFPEVFDYNWFDKPPKAWAQMIVGASDLIEPLILEPFYNQLRDQVAKQIGGHIAIKENNTYQQGKKMVRNGASYTISDVTVGDDQYVNTFQVGIDNGPGQTTLEISGRINFRKEVKKPIHIPSPLSFASVAVGWFHHLTSHLHVPRIIPKIISKVTHIPNTLGIPSPTPCTIHAHAEANIEWAASIHIIADKDVNGKPILKFDQDIKITHQNHSSSIEGCDGVANEVSHLIGQITNVFKFMNDRGFFEGLISNALKINTPDIGNVSNIFGHFGDTIQSFVMLPAGDVFFFKNPRLDPQLNFYLDLILPDEKTASFEAFEEEEEKEDEESLK